MGKTKEMERLLRKGKITKLEYIEVLRGIAMQDIPYRKSWTEEEKRTGNTPRVRAYCRRHGL